MTVGHELAKITNLRLFHNHLIIEALLPIFDFDSESYKKLTQEFRTRIFQEAIRAKLEGIIFTYVIAYNKPSGMIQLNDWIDLFKKNNFDVMIVELQASLEARLKRNETPHRLNHKHSKRDIVFSRNILLKNEHEWDMQPQDGIFGETSYLKLNNESMSAQETAQIICEKFKLKMREHGA